MDFVPWLRSITTVDSLFPPDITTIHLITPSLAGNFLVIVRTLLKKQGYETKLIDGTSLHKQQLDELLDMSVLAGKMVYIMYIEQEAGRKAKQVPADIFERSVSYQGPHQILLISGTRPKTSTHQRYLAIEIPEKIDFQGLSALCNLIGHSQYDGPLLDEIARTLRRDRHELSLESACVVAQYPRLLGRKLDQFCTRWLPQILSIDYSLFTLSQYLFERDSSRFYTLWSKVVNRYPDEFWLVYWSDLMWRAYMFTFIASRKGLAATTEYTRGLPFAFTKQSWRAHQPEIFAQSVELVYRFDCLHKQGGLLIPYELLFQRFLA